MQYWGSELNFLVLFIEQTLAFLCSLLDEIAFLTVGALHTLSELLKTHLIY